MKKIAILTIALAMIVGSLFAAPKEKKPPVVIFDPATTAVDAGEVVTIDGEKYLKIKPDGYGTQFNIPEVDLNGYKNFIAVMFADNEVKKYNITVKVCDADMGEISTPQLYGTVQTPKTIMAGKAKQESWGNKVSKSKIATILQPYVQDSSNNYAAVSDTTVFIGKITAQ